MKTITLMAVLMLLPGLIHAQTASIQDSPKNKSIVNQTPTHSMENQSKQIVQAFLTAVQQGNMEKVGTLLHPDVQWNQPGNNRVSGSKKSSKEVFQMVGSMFELSAQTLVLAEVKSLTAHGNQVASLLHWKAAQPVGTVLDVENIDVYTVQDGKIVAVTVFSSDIEQENKFWGK